MAYADAVTLSWLGSAAWQPVRGEDAHWKNPSSPDYAWLLLGAMALLERCEQRDKARAGEGTGQRSSRCNSSLLLHHQSPHQYARERESSFPTPLGSLAFREWQTHCKSSSVWESQPSNAPGATSSHSFSLHMLC